MRNFVLSCCSTADMPASYFAEREIPFVCFHFHLDGVEYPDDLGQSVGFADFYRRIRDGAQPSTSQVNEWQYMEFFEPMLAAGQDVLHLSFSSGLSGSYQSALIACEQLVKKYPERRLLVVDTLGASSGYGLLVDAVADLRDRDASIEEARDWAEGHKLNLHHWFFSTDLTSYLRGGRISRASYAIGYIMNIQPLLNMDASGHLIPRAKYPGKKRVVREILQRMELHAENGLDYAGKCFISHSDCLEEAQTVAALVEERFKKLNGRVMINSVGTVIGAHTGPGTVALFFFGDSRAD
ncbi:MAG: DegV family protein [Clostridia bacterium]|nr:DegV family protein [Clostridia bacterium]